MNIKIKVLTILTLLSIFFSCSTQKTVSTNYSYSTECLGVELDGSQTLKAWGNGRNREDAVEQAKKNAVRDVIFKGIRDGKQDCNQKPLVFEVNAQEKYEDYFNKFFADGGEYRNFISLKDERIFDKIKRDKQRTAESVTHGVIVRVLRSELKQKLIQDGIIK
jgi:hypothetical protein